MSKVFSNEVQPKSIVTMLLINLHATNMNALYSLFSFIKLDVVNAITFDQLLYVKT